MVFGKTTTLVVFLIISLKLSAEVCCDDYECNLIKDSGNCTSHSKCIYADQLCRDRKCSDRTSSNCEGILGVCKYTGGACVDAPLCSDWSDRPTDCPNHAEGDGPSQTICVVSGSACVKPTCGMHTTQPTCESGPPSCKWTGGTCVPISSCADYSSASCFPFASLSNGTICILDGTVCKGFNSCADLSGTSSISCSSAGCILSGGVCRDPKCSDYVSSTSCNSGYETSGSSSKPCYWDTSCHVAACSDWSSTSSTQCESNGYLSCVYNTDNTCSAFTCGSVNAGSSCDSRGCYWLSSCPVKENDDGGSASGILAPALLVALLLVLFW